MKLGTMKINQREWKLLDFKQKLTINQTPYEKQFARLLLRAREIKESHKTSRSIIHRQHIFTNGDIGYIVDFYVPRWRVVFEIDGKQHKQQKKYDEKRAKFINAQGVRVVRFWNYEIYQSNMLNKILKELN